MLFYSAHGRPRMSKAAMIAAVAASHAQPASAKVIARNTLDYTDADGVRRVRLHDTDILTVYPHGGFTVSTGGFNTKTTRGRLDDVLPRPWTVYTDKGRIHLRNRETGATWPFLETITVTRIGTVKSDVKPEKLDRLTKLVDAYMALYRKQGLPSADESGGDPWAIGSVSRETMMDWLRTKYRFRLMFVLACRYAGFKDTGILFWLDQIDRRGGKLDRTDLRRIRRYIRACLGLES